MEIKPGSRWRSTTCDTEVVVVRGPSEPAEMSCGGAPMVPLGEDAPRVAVASNHASGTLLGKRYADDRTGIEVLCTKAGEGSLAIDGEPLGTKQAKPLPASD